MRARLVRCGGQEAAHAAPTRVCRVRRRLGAARRSEGCVRQGPRKRWGGGHGRGRWPCGGDNVARGVGGAVQALRTRGAAAVRASRAQTFQGLPAPPPAFNPLISLRTQLLPSGGAGGGRALGARRACGRSPAGPIRFKLEPTGFACARDGGACVRGGWGGVAGAPQAATCSAPAPLARPPPRRGQHVSQVWVRPSPPPWGGCTTPRVCDLPGCCCWVGPGVWQRGLSSVRVRVTGVGTSRNAVAWVRDAKSWQWRDRRKDRRKEQRAAWGGQLRCAGKGAKGKGEVIVISEDGTERGGTRGGGTRGGQGGARGARGAHGAARGRRCRHAAPPPCRQPASA